MCARNWIKIDRKITEWEWYDNPSTKIVFLHLLFTARWQDGSWHGIEIKRGELLESLASIAERNGLTIKQVRKAMEHLEGTKSVTFRKAGKYRIIKVLEYEKYQSGLNEGHDDGTMRAQQGHDEGTMRAPLKERKESKNGKEGKNISPLPPLHSYGEYKHVKLTDEQYKKLAEDFGQDLTDGGIRAVDEYCEMNGKSYKNYALTIRKWGITSAREEGKKHGTGSGTETIPQQDYDDWYRRVAEIAGDVRRRSESGADDFSG